MFLNHATEVFLNQASEFFLTKRANDDQVDKIPITPQDLGCIRAVHNPGERDWTPEQMIQGYLAYKKLPIPLGPPKGPRNSPTVGS